VLYYATKFESLTWQRTVLDKVRGCDALT